MFSIRLNRKLLILALVGIVLYFSVSAWYATKGEDNPDTLPPTPAVTKEIAEKTALDWFEREVGGTARVEEVVHTVEKQAQVYLEKNKLTKQYEDAYKDLFPLEYWRVGLVADNGSRLYLRIGLEENRVFGILSPKPHSESAIVLKTQQPDELFAELGYSPQDYQIKVFRNQDKTEAVSPTFRFEPLQPTIGEAKLVVDYSTGPDGITQMVPSLQPPAEFLSWLHKQDTGAGLYSMLYMIGAFTFGIVGLILMILKRKNASFRRGILFSLVFLAAISIHTYNSLPAQRASVGVSESGLMSDSFLAIVSIVLYALLAVSLYFNAVSGDVLWKERGWKPWPSWKDERFGQHVYASMGRGYLLCLFIMGVQQVLFLFAYNAFDTFSVNDPSQSMENLYWPWVFPTLAWYAGIGEEIVFRLFGISLFRKILPNGRNKVSQHLIRFISVLLPTLIWAAGHASYAFYPNYTRLFEVTALGLIFGYIFLRYGLYTAIFAHVSMDVILMALSYMVGVRTPGSIALGLFYMATPFLVAAIILFLHKTFWRKPPATPDSLNPTPDPSPHSDSIPIPTL
ncbi:CPBP family intramembrane glutamic endopeptidase [Gorillibacterium sp. CAU 1737]|uniref:CPBP family intramembrane glutamic endopeptidase n=1 Tax=Gorillibacterium sp. CAU 1737 TaxID=3140362 RepID=UPI003260BEC7